MSNKSGVSEQVISLPKGGGALKGMGETFSPDLHTGTGNFSIPLQVPAGRNGFQPDLKLVYSTGSGNGPFGLGWNLSIPGVSRKTDRGVPRYQDDLPTQEERLERTSRDVFLLSGAEDLVPVPGATVGRQRYRPRTEGLFARIEHDRTPGHDHSGINHSDNNHSGINHSGNNHSGNNHWEVASKDGLVSLYGAPDLKNHPTTLADPAHPERIFAWKLTRTVDPFGNRIEYLYEQDQGPSTGPRQWTQLYLKEIHYVDFGDPSSPQFLVTIRFVYQDRPDPFSSSRAGFEIRTTRRCTAVEVRTHAEKERLTRTYHLIYLDQVLPQEDLPHNRVSLLHQVKVEGHDDTRSETLPPLELRYTRFEPRGRTLRPVTGPDLPATSLAHPGIELADLSGNGLPDLVQIDGVVRYWQNLGNGTFARPRTMRDAPAGLRLGDPGVQLMDADGDGRVDLVVTSGSLAGYYPATFSGGWDRRSFRRYEHAPSFDFSDPLVKLVDLTGDGVTDVLRTGSRLECFFQDPKRGWIPSPALQRRGLDVFPSVDFSDPRVRLADMTGDGLQDIVLLVAGRIDFWPSRGYGSWGPRQVMSIPHRLPEDFDPKRVLLVDVDGDGLADLLYIDHGRVLLWINQSGNGFADPIVIPGTPGVADMDAVRGVDLLGTGTPGILWSADAGGTWRHSMYFLDLTAGVKPYVLIEMDNHLGALTRVAYGSSIQHALRDAARAETRWRTPLPFPVQVVDRVERIDVLSGGKLTTEYAYHHGYWDGGDREFRGFGHVEQRDTESFERYSSAGLHPNRAFSAVDHTHFSPPTLTRTWFHQGPVGDAHGDWHELDLSHEYWLEPWGEGPPRATVLARPPAVTALLEGLTGAQRPLRREAIRALRSRILRTELYALDGSPLETRPYTVTEAQHGVTFLKADGGVEDLSPPTEPGATAPKSRWPSEPMAWQSRVFFAFSVSERTTQWERGDEPMTRCKFTADYDPFGQPRWSLDVAVPRGRDFRATLPPTTPGQPWLATMSETVYARPSEVPFITDRVARTTGFELCDVPLDTTGLHLRHLSLEALVRRAWERTAPRSVISQNLTYYDGAAFEGLPLGSIGPYGAPVRTAALVASDAMMEQLLRPTQSGIESNAESNIEERPPYLGTSTPLWRDEYPPAFRAAVATNAGYVTGLRNEDNTPLPGWFVMAERKRYDFQPLPEGVNDAPGVDPKAPARGLVTHTRDPLGRDAIIGHDSYGLLPVLAIDPVGLETRAHHDYRVLQPSQVLDPNHIRTHFTFSPLGLLQATSILDKEVDSDGRPLSPRGDTPDRPSVRLEYDFHAFARRGEPVFIRQIKRLHHALEGDVAENEREEVLESVEYSDGFGRLLQTRTQAEDVLFRTPFAGSGDSAVESPFGDAGLPLDPAKGGGAAVGRRRGIEPNVVVSGWQTYDNKGQVVEKYEPFFSTGWACNLEEARKLRTPLGGRVAQKVTLYYDPLGRAVRTVNPDGSEMRVVQGVPNDLKTPDHFRPTPWEAYSYDPNDNSGRTHPQASESYKSHRDTPSSVEVDALGRTVVAIARTAQPGSTGQLEVIPVPTRSTYDIRGNVLSVTDSLGRVIVRTEYDLANRPWRTVSIDAGVERMVLDAAGNALEVRDSRGVLVLTAYDALSRPERVWARDASLAPLILRQRLEYGDGGRRNQPEKERSAQRDANRLGRLHRHYDEAGLLEALAYDFKGNLLEKVRRVLSDKSTLALFSSPHPGWEVAADQDLPKRAEALLDASGYQTSSTYDALNRVKQLLYPADVKAHRAVARPRYNRAGSLEKVDVDGQPFVTQLAYNARGQRLLIAYGNGVMTRYAYDPLTFRLARMRSEALSPSSSSTAASISAEAGVQPGSVLQDFSYQYDLAGNLLTLVDEAPGSGVAGNPLASSAAGTRLGPLLNAGDALVRTFAYDPLYRLIQATGRELKGLPRPWPASGDAFGGGRCAVPTDKNARNVTTLYREQYRYDLAGNMLELRHETAELGPAGVQWPSWSRVFGIGGMTPKQWQQEATVRAAAWREVVSSRVSGGEWAGAPGNQLTHVGNSAPGDQQTHLYDSSGNLIQENHNRHTTWDYADRLRGFAERAGQGPASVEAVYLYDASGERVKKLVRKNGGPVHESTTYIDGLLEHHRQGENARTTKENNTLHIMDDTRRIALVRVGAAFEPSDDSPAVQYQLGDHLDSSAVVVGADGQWIRAEEYSPYGETTLGSFYRKRYRFTGKERDDESGLNYHSARYYAPWLGRWISTDPAGLVENLAFFSPSQTHSDNSRFNRAGAGNLYGYVLSSPLSFTDDSGCIEEATGFWSLSLQTKLFDHIQIGAKFDPEGVSLTASLTAKPVNDSIGGANWEGLKSQLEVGIGRDKVSIEAGPSIGTPKDLGLTGPDGKKLAAPIAASASLRVGAEVSFKQKETGLHLYGSTYLKGQTSITLKQVVEAKADFKVGIRTGGNMGTFDSDALLEQLQQDLGLRGRPIPYTPGLTGPVKNELNRIVNDWKEIEHKAAKFHLESEPPAPQAIQTHAADQRSRSHQ